MNHFDLPDEARHARIENRFLLRSASLPPQHAQHRRALGTPELRAGLRRKEGYLLSPLPGLVPRQSKSLTRTFNYTPKAAHVGFWVKMRVRT